MKRVLRYVGEDREIVAMLQKETRASDWQWTELRCIGQLESCLRRRNLSRFPDHLSNGVEYQRWLRDRFSPIILELDFDQPGAAEVVRNVRKLDSVASVIVLSRQSTLTSYAIARMNGATAFFTRPLYDLKALIEAIQAAFEANDRWERTLVQM